MIQIGRAHLMRTDVQSYHSVEMNVLDPPELATLVLRGVEIVLGPARRYVLVSGTDLAA
jgi:hypothetical protein